jgi:hypothetical protein
MTRRAIATAVIVILAWLLLVVLTAVLPSAARATPAFCAERARIAERLETEYSEQLVGGGMQSQTGLIEVWAATTGATWTILMTRPDGTSCVMATGTDWVTPKPVPAGEAS